MTIRRRRLLPIAIAFWSIAVVALVLLARIQIPAPGWDAKSYADFVLVVKNGQDPYQDSLSDQNAYRERLLRHASPPVRVSCVDPPCGWVYSPLSLPFLKLAAKLPLPLLTIGYVAICLLCAIATPVLLLSATRPGIERTIFSLLAPATLFFAGLILNYVIFCGNVAYILYGIVFAGAALGWKRQQWLPFYLAVLVASCFKTPLLTLLAIAFLSDRKAWRGTLLAAIAGLCLLAAQPLFWPKEFPLYLQVIDMLFRYDADFGFSPAGLLATLLGHMHRPYSPWTVVAYLTYSPIIVAVLWTLRRRYLHGAITLQGWIPVMLLGTLLLNPRNKEYDLAAFTVPMALITWRFFGRTRTVPRAVIATALFILGLEIVSDRIGLQLTYGLLTPALWTAGALDLLFPVHPRLSSFRQRTE